MILFEPVLIVCMHGNNLYSESPGCYQRCDMLAPSALCWRPATKITYIHKHSVFVVATYLWIIVCRQFLLLPIWWRRHINFNDYCNLFCLYGVTGHDFACPERVHLTNILLIQGKTRVFSSFEDKSLLLSLAHLEIYCRKLRWGLTWSGATFL